MTIEKTIIRKYELACDWLGEPVSEEVNRVTIECLDFDMKQALIKYRKKTLDEVEKIIDRWFNHHRCVGRQYCAVKAECYNVLLEEIAKLKEKAT